jgi:hypothetical protein
MALAKKWKEVMFANRIYVDVLHHDHLVVLFGEECLVEDLVGVLLIARRQILPGLGHSGRRLVEALARRVLADLLQELTDQVFHVGHLAAQPRYSKVLLSVSTTATRRRVPAARAGSSHCQNARARFSPVVVTSVKAGTALDRS